MQIRETQLELSASHQASLVVQQETSSTLTFRQVLGEVDRRESAAPDLQKEMRRLLYSLLDALLAAIEGEWGEEKTAACRPAAGEAEPTSAPAAQGARWQTVQVEQGCEKEATKVCAQGWVTTRDGERLAFDLHWQMQREFSWQGTRVAVRDVQLRDPLMLSFAGPACALSEQTIASTSMATASPSRCPCRARTAPIWSSIATPTGGSMRAANCSVRRPARVLPNWRSSMAMATAGSMPATRLSASWGCGQAAR